MLKVHILEVAIYQWLYFGISLCYKIDEYRVTNAVLSGYHGLQNTVLFCCEFYNVQCSSKMKELLCSGVIGRNENTEYSWLEVVWIVCFVIDNTIHSGANSSLPFHSILFYSYLFIYFFFSFLTFSLFFLLLSVTLYSVSSSITFSLLLFSIPSHSISFLSQTSYRQ